MSWTGTQEKMSKFVDEITRLSLWIFYADRPVCIYDITLIWLIHFVNESLDVMMLLIAILQLRWTAYNIPTMPGSLLRNFALNCVKLLRWTAYNIAAMPGSLLGNSALKCVKLLRWTAFNILTMSGTLLWNFALNCVKLSRWTAFNTPTHGSWWNFYGKPPLGMWLSLVVQLSS